MADPIPVNGARTAADPIPVQCPGCTSDRLLERLEGGWMLCNVCSRTFRPPGLEVLANSKPLC